MSSRILDIKKFNSVGVLQAL